MCPSQAGDRQWWRKWITKSGQEPTPICNCSEIIPSSLGQVAAGYTFDCDDHPVEAGWYNRSSWPPHRWRNFYSRDLELGLARQKRRCRGSLKVSPNPHGEPSYTLSAFSGYRCETVTHRILLEKSMEGPRGFRKTITWTVAYLPECIISRNKWCNY